MQDGINASRTAPGASGPLDNSTSGQLAHLSEMDDYEIAEGEPDIKGWDVRTATGEKVGEVEDLIVDTALMKVRYIEIKFEKLLADSGEQRRALIPIGSSRLDADADDVVLDLRDEQLMSLPGYLRGDLTRDYESQLLTGMQGTTSHREVIDPSGHFYDGEHFDEGRAFERRRATGRRDDSYLRRRER